MFSKWHVYVKIKGVAKRDRLYLRNRDSGEIKLEICNEFNRGFTMSQDSFPSRAVNGYVHGRSRGRPKKRWIDVVRDDCENTNVDVHTATTWHIDRI